MKRYEKTKKTWKNTSIPSSEYLFINNYSNEWQILDLLGINKKPKFIIIIRINAFTKAARLYFLSQGF